jgi:hypothetical protein
MGSEGYTSPLTVEPVTRDAVTRKALPTEGNVIGRRRQRVTGVTVGHQDRPLSVGYDVSLPLARRARFTSAHESYGAEK